jgi:hypothetical protein
MTHAELNTKVTNFNITFAIKALKTGELVEYC